ncbi:ECT2 protein, partial [Polyodon spathula]|nr:ECT2 protein [Polyodon spathula]
MDARAGESMYSYEKAGSPTLKKSVSLLSLNTPNSNRKRRRLQDTLAQLTRETDISPFPPHKRTSGEHSLSIGSLLDISNTPESGKAAGDYTPHRVVTRSRKNCSRTPGNHRPTRHSCRWRNERAKQNIPEKEGQLEIDLQPRPGVGKASVYLLQAEQEHVQLQDGFTVADEEEEVSGMQISYNFSEGDCMTKSHTFRTSETKACEKTPRSTARPSKSSTPVPQKQSARWQVAKELYQTESNYVDILTTVLQLFKDPLEKEGQLGGPILAVEEIKTIFGSIPDIFDVHTRIKAELEELVLNWSEDKSVGDIILKYSKELVKAYPPFVNFFEMSKETIAKCEKQKPRFHAFLKINQSKPECGRQTLAELLIRPVQRLPSVALLLNDIRKHTADDNPDKVTLEKAIESLKEVMTHINEDKRKTEGQKQIFDVVYEVDNCPANLLSSHRSLVHRVETISLGDKPCDRGENVTLFLFSDCLEIARKRHKVISTFRSPHGGTRPQASLKHITLMPLSQIRKVLDLKETEDCHNAFALVVRPPTEQDNLLFSFQLAAEDTLKEDWLRMLCRHVANTICKADAENLIQRTDPDSLQVNTKDMDSSTLSRASRAIKKTSKKVTRAFSFTKTPKRVIQRAFLANSTPDSPTAGTGNYLGGRLASTSSLAISRSSSTFSLNCSARHANVHRSNSLDASSPSSRPRAPICTETPKKHISNNRVSASCTSSASSTIPTAFEPSEQSPQSVSSPQRSSLVTRKETLL